ncbi:DUF1232 domain-containing protein [Saccharibacillus brassicae]|uniref:DUF1232 domain-containing protein n=1 Tax=Saccharibacillus brassicae TaxID=2583377 RepID=A0A4Y6UX17_SACBS|nr:DUF1232 domain-containing protein [Saccharibacillus brassicae]
MADKKSWRERAADYGRDKFGVGVGSGDPASKADAEADTAAAQPIGEAELNKRIEGYGKQYSDDSFWDKVKTVGKKAGVKVVYAALLLFYTLKDADVPPWAKSVIIGALAYFIAPIDLIPDFIPVVGFTDDFGTLIAAVAVVAKLVNDETRGKARAKLVSWFGESATLDLGEVEAKLEPLSVDREALAADADAADVAGKGRPKR